MEKVRMLNAGEQGLVIEFGDQVDPQVNRKVHRLAERIKQAQLVAVIETVPTYRSLLVYFNPLQISRQQLKEKLFTLLQTEETVAGDAEECRVVTIPVCYAGEFAPDIEFVASHNKLAVDEVVQIHTSKPYLVYMLGFIPGFPYLGGMSEKIATPRLKTPRTKIPAGSVGIAGSQTGFYPVESPGGWQIIGRTPIRSFNPKAEQSFLFVAGDYLKFQPITPEEYEKIRLDVEAGTYKPLITIQKGGC